MGNARLFGYCLGGLKLRVAVVETFISVQGEGPSVGEPAAFLRLAGCNLACDWCDTRYSWDWSRYDHELVEQIESPDLARRLQSFVPNAVSLLVVTGGEPMLQRHGLADTLSDLLTIRPDLRVEVETNGTIFPGDELCKLVTLFVVSPKLANAGEKNKALPSTVSRFAELPSVLKFVARSEADIDEAATFAIQSGFPSNRVWVMPEGTTAADFARHARAITERAVSFGFRLSPRLHVSIWGDERGR